MLHGRRVVDILEAMHALSYFLSYVINELMYCTSQYLKILSDCPRLKAHAILINPSYLNG